MNSKFYCNKENFENLRLDVNKDGVLDEKELKPPTTHVLTSLAQEEQKAEAASPQEGETVQHEITVTNNGAGTATSVNLLDSLPTTVGDKTLVGGFPTQGSWVSGASNWSVANLPAVDPKHDGSIAEGARGHFDAEPPWRGPDAALRQRGITDD